MTTPKSARKKTMLHQHHGLYALDRALEPSRDREGWLKELGDIGIVLKEWEQSIINDLGGDKNISAIKRSIVEMATKTHLFLASVDAYLLELPCLINRSRQQLFPVVVQRQILANALSGYMRQLGLKRRAKPVQPLQDYLKERCGKPGGLRAEDLFYIPDPDQPVTVQHGAQEVDVGLIQDLRAGRLGGGSGKSI